MDFGIRFYVALLPALPQIEEGAIAVICCAVIFLWIILFAYLHVSSFTLVAMHIYILIITRNCLLDVVVTTPPYSS